MILNIELDDWFIIKKKRNIKQRELKKNLQKHEQRSQRDKLEKKLWGEI